MHVLVICEDQLLVAKRLAVELSLLVLTTSVNRDRESNSDLYYARTFTKKPQEMILYIDENFLIYSGNQEMFQKHICPPWYNIKVYLLCRSKICPKQVKVDNTLGSEE